MTLRAHLHAITLAWRHLIFHGFRSCTIILALGISIALPLVTGSLLERGEVATMERAEATPLVLGAPGGSVDLVLASLWFLPEPLDSFPIRESDAINESRLATSIPLSLAARASGHPVVGTDVEYLRYRGRFVENGRSFAVPGECVLGADVAASTGLGPGDVILTDPEGLLDIGGGYPLRLRITGVLARSESADDAAVFCDLRTSWIIAGHGHVHIEIDEETDPHVLMGDNEGRPIASAAVTPYTELTPDRLDSLHFHGAPSDLPIEAIIIIPNDEKSGTILSARLDRREDLLLVTPSSVVREILERVFKVGALVGGVLLATGAATLAVIGLVLVLSVRLRKDELTTLRMIGISRGTYVTLLLSEVVILIVFATIIGLLAVWASSFLPADLVLRLAN